jgi:hypothetical protein
MTKNRKENCSFNKWFQGDFARKSIKSISIPLPESFISYLKEDGIALSSNPEYKDTTSIDCDSYLSSNSEENENEVIQKSFPVLESQIEKAIRDLGGHVFPKLNWSSPKDASWIAFGGTLKCQTKDDIFLLLKASDFIQSDLEQIEDTNLSDGYFYLVLRKWVDLNPSLEFRCFVVGHKLVGNVFHF